MLAKKRAERQHAIAATAGGERKKELQKLKRRREESNEEAKRDGRSSERKHRLLGSERLSEDPMLLSAEDPTSVLRAIGDHVNTRLKELDFDDDIDADLFDERQRQLREEAELAAGTRSRLLASHIAEFLHKQQKKGTIEFEKVENPSATDVSAVFVAHNSNAVTAVCSLGNEIVFLGDKTGAVYFVELRDNAGSTRKELLSPCLSAAVLSIAVSDTRGVRPSQRTLFERTTADVSVTSYVAVGAADGTIGIWVTDTRRHLGTLTMHRSAVTGLAFRNDTLYSGGYDEALRVWALPQMSCEDKLFGHTGRVFGLHCLRRERCATVGDDGTMRFWKVDAATQQEFTASAHFGGKVVLECVVMMNDFIVLCGAANGALLVFDVGKRKPVAVREGAHGYGFVGDGTGLESEAIAMRQKSDGSVVSETRIPNPITAVAAIPYSDTAASASYDGVVRLWRVGAASESSGKTGTGSGVQATPVVQPSSLDCLASIPVRAIVTSLYFPPTSDVLLIACSKEPRLGRWVVQRSALNSVYVVPLNQETRFKLSSRGRVEHLPTLLYGIDNDGASDEADRMEDATEGLSDAGGRGGSYRSHDEEGNGGEEGDDGTETDNSTGMFTVGEEGQMKFSMPMSNGDRYHGTKKKSKKRTPGAKGEVCAPKTSSKRSSTEAAEEERRKRKKKKNKKKGAGGGKHSTAGEEDK
ncbi:hypothetical protein, conserved [Trypanosoma brucei gambiense DAL972]|uniref:Uncharacterized protein n=1 Tax=Trypanosoma brucei gambiense (strain MHOM/CI/86/DAL972) TaxID=679716 RepID=D0A1V8_TRYB9|nr:hypothetical protein, conserved [Trypanosoma brucei gambiense DAL972]CBH15251.1 hypothetical protein, conserved [Trypanosoma brucei gambiense DAL972]|eukprot:XP_011777516.1 hypothetical protein, conserved [Trypanosoma brucei gambiense DAL972]